MNDSRHTKRKKNANSYNLLPKYFFFSLNKCHFHQKCINNLNIFLHFIFSISVPSHACNKQMCTDLMHTDLQATSLDLNYDGSQSPGSGGSLTQQTRNKRMRTSFKHHQLRTMKSYFAINQNPDAKDLKQLSQKTGLSKRVLQVIEQSCNYRAERKAKHECRAMHIPSAMKQQLPLCYITKSIINDLCILPLVFFIPFCFRCVCVRWHRCGSKMHVQSGDGM